MQPHNHRELIGAWLSERSESMRYLMTRPRPPCHTFTLFARTRRFCITTPWNRHTIRNQSSDDKFTDKYLLPQYQASNDAYETKVFRPLEPK